MPWFHYEAGMTKTIRLDTERVYISAARGAALATKSGRFERQWQKTNLFHLGYGEGRGDFVDAKLLN